MLRFVALFLWLSILFCPIVYSQSKPLKKIHVGVPSVTVGNIIIYVAKEAGLFEKYGLDAEIVVVQGSGVASKAMIGGSLDVAPVATPTVISANLAGADLTILAHTMPSVIHALMVKSEIKRPEDLKGKKIAISSFGSLTDFLVRAIMKKKGLSPDRDVSFLQIGGDAERLAALNQGVADAAAISYPGYARAQKLGFAMLWDSSKEINYPWMEIVTRRATILRDRGLVLNYMKAHLEGIALFKQNSRFGRRVIRRTLKLNDGELVSGSYELFARSFLSTPHPNLSGMKTSFEYVAQTSPEIWNHKPEKFVDTSFVEELDKSGFIKKLYEK
jgi:ABC-type nitrate/sulfonate/bicarbonate transport system substrate-binding protein